jgi:hypothetical protein
VNVVRLPEEPATGEALLQRGRLRDARERFWNEAEEAELAGDGDGLAAAALGLGGVWVLEHRSTLERALVGALQRRALAALAPDHPLAGQLRTRLAAEQAYLAGDPAPVLAELEAARAGTDAVRLAEALSLAHHCTLGPHHATLRWELAEELIAVSPETGRPVDALMGLAWRTIDLFLAGDRRALRSLAELRECLDTTPFDCLGYVVAALEVMLAIRDGRLDQAEELALRCYELGVDVGDADALGWYGAQLVTIRWLQGRGEDVLSLLGELEESPTVAEPCFGFVAATAALAAGIGDRATATTALATLRKHGLDAIAPSSIWSATMLGACEAAHLLGDVEAAEEAYRVLAPYADLPIMASLAVACFGSAHRPLGLAAWTVGDLELAIHHLERAATADVGVGNQPCHALDRATLADVLDDRGRPGDAGRAAALRRGAVEDAERFGMAVRAAEWRLRLGPERCGGVTVRRDGQVWRVALGNRSALVPHSVGMDYLACLIDNAGTEISAVDLVSRHTVRGRTRADQPLLDETAKAHYRRQIEALQQEAADAEACADLERATRARAELNCFVEQLAEATGFAGRGRAFTDEAERARISVQKAIKRALAAIGQCDPELGDHLRRHVTTGARCTYRRSGTWAHNATSGELGALGREIRDWTRPEA